MCNTRMIQKVTFLSLKIFFKTICNGIHYLDV